MTKTNTVSIETTKEKKAYQYLLDQENFKLGAGVILVFLIILSVVAGALSFIYGEGYISFSVCAVGIALYLLARYTYRGTMAHLTGISLAFTLLCGHLILLHHGSFVFHFLYIVPIVLFQLFQDRRAYIPLLACIAAQHVVLSFVGGSDTPLFPEGTPIAFKIVYYTLWASALLVVYIILQSTKDKNKSYNEMKGQWQRISSYFSINIEFAKEIASGNLDSKHTVTQDDELGKCLLEMRENLKLTSEESKNRNWATQGIATVEEILRLNNNNIDNLSFAVISTLTKYLDANQGAIFIINTEEEEDPFLELKGCYAYNKRKYLDKKINVGQGLVGQAVIEKDTIVITEIPKDYVNITSGLGQATPRCLIIVPLKIEDQVVGAMEIASFVKFEPHQINFLNKVAESVASAVLTSKNNHRTSILLEESQKLAEKLKAQEEEVRQNVEELQATQEELQRKNSEFEEFMEIFNEYALRIEYDLKGTVTNVSPKALELTNYSKTDIVGKKFHAIIPETHAATFNDAFWKQVVGNKVSELNIPIKDKRNEIIWLKVFFKPVEYMPGFARKVNLIGFPIKEETVVTNKGEPLLKA